MLAFADLEIGLHRRDSDSYAVDLRYSAPDSDTDVRLLQDGTALVQFDQERARSLALDEVAYGRFLGDCLLGEANLRAAFAQARSSDHQSGPAAGSRLAPGRQIARGGAVPLERFRRTNTRRRWPRT